jgi:hypothetical protein
MYASVQFLGMMKGNNLVGGAVDQHDGRFDHGYDIEVWEFVAGQRASRVEYDSKYR